MDSVLKHNVHDVLSLAALTVCACDRVVREPAALDSPLDLYSLARIMENTSEWKTRYRLVRDGARGGLDGSHLPQSPGKPGGAFAAGRQSFAGSWDSARN